MTTVDQDAVQVLAVLLHREQCLPGSALNTRYSTAHLADHRAVARRVLAGLAESSYVLTGKEGQ